jgi:hypothetical protein
MSRRMADIIAFIMFVMYVAAPAAAVFLCAYSRGPVDLLCAMALQALGLFLWIFSRGILIGTIKAENERARGGGGAR